MHLYNYVFQISRSLLRFVNTYQSMEEASIYIMLIETTLMLHSQYQFSSLSPLHVQWLIATVTCSAQSWIQDLLMSLSRQSLMSFRSRFASAEMTKSSSPIKKLSLRERIQYWSGLVKSKTPVNTDTSNLSMSLQNVNDLWDSIN